LVEKLAQQVLLALLVRLQVQELQLALLQLEQQVLVLQLFAAP
jgi:hypothetical protein